MASPRFERIVIGVLCVALFGALYSRQELQLELVSAKQARATEVVSAAPAVERRALRMERGERGVRPPSNLVRDPAPIAARHENALEAPMGVQATEPELTPELERKAVSRFFQRRGDERTAQMMDRVDEVATEEGWSDQTYDAVIAVVDRSSTAMQELRAAIHDGDLAWEDARPEFRAIHESSQTDLEALLGEEKYEAFQEKVWSDHRGPPRGR